MRYWNKFWFYALISITLFAMLIWSCTKDEDNKILSITTTEITQITKTSALCGGEITSDGGLPITLCGVCWWSTNQNPTINNNKTEDNVENGSFISTISGLEENTTYYIRAYATNIEGTVYGKTLTFKTLEEIAAPSLTTTEVKETSRTTASSGGTIISDGGRPITSRGVVWSTTENPTINDNIGITIDGKGDGIFSSFIDSLATRETYYIRAYATNSEGTGYGNTLTLTTSGSWLRKADFGGVARGGAVSFCIGEMGYVGTGAFSNSNGGYVHKGDLWQYDQNENTWSKQEGSIEERAGAIGFSINDKGYIGFGAYFGMLFYEYADFWSYSPDDLVLPWKELNRPGRNESGFGFSINSKGYAGFAVYYDNNFWEFDPVTNIWIQKTKFPGLYPNFPTCFTIGDKAYVCTGCKPSEQSYGKELWEYDPSTDSWTRKADFEGPPRVGAVGFSIGDKGYIGTGSYGNTYFKDFWEYDPSTDSWTQLEDFKGVPRSYAVGFAIGNKGYIGTGKSIDGDLNDFWEFDPEI